MTRAFFTAIGITILLAAGVFAADPPGLGEAIDSLKIISGATPSRPLNLDYNNDAKVGMEETLFILQYVAGLRELEEDLTSGITVSGTVRDASAVDEPVVENVIVQLQADLNGDDAYQNDEMFSAQTDTNGFFAINIPNVVRVPRMTIHTTAPGYTEFIKKYNDVEKSFSVAVNVSGGDFTEIDISGVSASPARAGRKVLMGNETVTISLYKDRLTGRSTARAGLGRFGGGDAGANGHPLVQVSFPLSGMRVTARSEKIYANVGYLDTVNQPDIMPGDFQSRSESGGPDDLLTTYAATQIKLFDENGNPLMTDPSNQANTINIKVALPPSAYDSLFDEDANTLDVVEVPLYYFDEDEEIWKLHKDADDNTLYGHLEDNFGNILNQDDLFALKNAVFDEQGTVVSMDYAPGGATPAEITIYTVGMVNHFTSWNCDRAGTSRSLNFDLYDKNGNPINDVLLRILKSLGGTSSDQTTLRGGGGRGNGHAGAPPNLEAFRKFIPDLLSKDPNVRNLFLKQIDSLAGDKILQGYIDALPGAIDAMGMEQRTGFGAILHSSEYIAAMSAAEAAGRASIDCDDNPKLCRELLHNVADVIEQHGDAEDAAKLFTEIGVEMWNPAKVTDVKNAMKRGLQMLDAAMKLKQDKSMLGRLPGLMTRAIDLSEQIGSLDPSANNYRELLANLQDAVKAVKEESIKVGAKTYRTAPGRAVSAWTAGDPTPIPASDEEAADLEGEIYREFEDIGGIFYGANHFSRYKFGYYQDGQFNEVEPPADLAGGGEVAQIEYFDGGVWRPLPGRSDQGVDARFVPVPGIRSYKDGSPGSPVSYLGKWQLDVDLDIDTSGRLLVAGTPSPWLAGSAIYVNNTPFVIGADGTFQGTFTKLYEGQVNIYHSGAQYWNYVPVSGKTLALGDISVADRLLFENNSASPRVALLDDTAAIDATAHTLSGQGSVSYDLKIYSSWYSMRAGELPMYEIRGADSGILPLPPFADYGQPLGVVTAAADGLPSIQKFINIQVVNMPPVVEDIAISPAFPQAGDSFIVTMNATDPDSTPDFNEIVREYIQIVCEDPDNYRFALSPKEGADQDGNRFWTVSTDDDRIFRVAGPAVNCNITGTARDANWQTGVLDKPFTIARRDVPPVVAYNYIRDEYIGPRSVSLNPGSAVRFTDRNSDIVAYELRCDATYAPLTSDEPIMDVNPLVEGNQPCSYTEPKINQISGLTEPYEFSYAAIDGVGNRTEVTSGITILQPIDLTMNYPDDPGFVVTAPGADLPDGSVNNSGLDIVQLPADTGNGRTFTLNLNAASGNGDGTIPTFNYQVYYGYWNNLASGTLENGSGDVNVEITKPGNYRVYMSATDNTGMSASFTSVFRVTAPYDYDLQVNGQSGDEAPPWFLAGGNIPFTADLIDAPEGFTGQYQWYVKYEGDADFSWAGSSPTYNNSFQAGVHTVRLVLNNTSDISQPSVIKDVTVTVYAPLTAAIATDYNYPVQAGVVALGDLLPLRVEVGNLAEGGFVKSVSWLVRRADYSSAESRYKVVETNDISQRSLLFTQSGNYLVTVYVADNRGLTTSAAFPVSVAEYPPVIDSLTAGKTLAAPGSEVVFTAAASDPDGQVVNYIFRLTGETVESTGAITNLDLTVIQNSANMAGKGYGATIFKYTFNKLGTYQLSLAAEDNSGRKSPALTVDVTVAHQPPVVTSLMAGKSSGEAPLNDVLFTAAASDPDNDITDYNWAVDGVGKQNGPNLTTFTYSFPNLGSYTVTVTVTDAKGLTGSRSTGIFVYDATSAPVFHFRDLWGDGPGQDYDFAAAAGGEMHHEGGIGQFAKVGYPEAIQVPAEPTSNVFEPASTMVGLPGYNGFYANSWGDPQISLVNISGNGGYNVGLTPPMGYDKTVTVRFPTQYVCGKLLNGGYYSQSFGVYWDGTPTPPEPAGEIPMWLSQWEHPDVMTTQGHMQVIGLLGTEVADGACVISYYGTVGGTVWPIADPESPPVLTLSAATVITAKPVQMPADHSLVKAEYYSGGIWRTLPAEDLQKNASGQPLLPVITGADYRLTISSTSGNATRAITKTLTATQIGSGDAIVLTAAAVQDISVAWQNLPVDVVKVEVTYIAGADKATTMATLEEGSYTLEGIAGLTGATRIEIRLYNSNGYNLAYYKQLAASAFTNAIDFNTLFGLSITDVAIAVDGEKDTLTISYNANGSICFLDISAGYEDYRYQYFRILTNQGGSPLTFNYVIPEMTLDDPWGSEPITYPRTDALTNVQIYNITCAQPTDGYDAFIRAGLEKMGDNQSLFYLQGRLEEGDTDELIMVRNPAQWPLTP